MDALKRRVSLSPTSKNILKYHTLIYVLTAFLLYTTSYLPSFDTSAEILIPTGSRWRWEGLIFRWDMFHFSHIAQRGYEYEYEFAFFPGVPLVLNLLGRVGRWLYVRMNIDEGRVVAFGGSFIVFCISGFTALDLYQLTFLNTSSHSLSYLSTLLSLFSSSPVPTRVTTYSEPFLTFFSYRGMLLCERKKWFSASACFMLAGVFRANGILLGGYIGWGLLVVPLLRERKLPLRNAALAIPLLALILAPFMGQQYYAYTLFCLSPNETDRAEWCRRKLPLVYSYVQDHYWGVGFLQYWNLSQIPNFLLAAPPFLLLLWASLTTLSNALPALFGARQNTKPGPFDTIRMIPYALHTLVLTLTLLLASHTQIILRVSSTLPFTYWSASRLFLEHPKWARWWIGWSVVWGAVSIVFWGVFLPPA